MKLTAQGSYRVPFSFMNILCSMILIIMFVRCSVTIGSRDGLWPDNVNLPTGVVIRVTSYYLLEFIMSCDVDGFIFSLTKVLFFLPDHNFKINVVVRYKKNINAVFYNCRTISLATIIAKVINIACGLLHVYKAFWFRQKNWKHSDFKYKYKYLCICLEYFICFICWKSTFCFFSIS